MNGSMRAFDPPREIRQLRQILRHRQSLLDQHKEVHNQIRYLLETAKVKLFSVASDQMGVTGQRILRALADDYKNGGICSSG